MRRVGTEKAIHHYPASNTRLQANSVPLGSAEWGLDVGLWPPKPVKWNISRHRGRQEDKSVGSVVACCQRSDGSPTCNLTLSHPVGEGWLANQWQLASGSPPAGHWCYVCRAVLPEFFLDQRNKSRKYKLYCEMAGFVKNRDERAT